MSSTEVESLTSQLSEATVDGGKKLSYAGKGLKLNTEEDAADIEREISHFQDLEVLCLEGNTVGVDAAKAIARGLKNHPEFKRAQWSDMFTGRSKTEIPPALQHMSEAMMLSGVKLTELDLSDNAFGPNGIKGVQDLLRSETCYTLEILKLNNNGLGPSGGKILASCLDECYEASLKTGKPMGLKVFVSGRGRLEDEGARRLSPVFKKMGTLEFVAMRQNGIRHGGITELAAAFAENKNLKHLDLNDNTFIIHGAKAMALAVKQMPNLECIDFGDCLIRTEGAILIANALKDGHSNLKELIMSGNEIKKEGGLAIANSIANKENISKIELGANNFGEEGVEEIKSILEPLGEVLDELDDDEGSEVEEDDDEAGDGSEEEDEDDVVSDGDDDVQVVQSDLMDIMEDPSVTKSRSSAGSLVDEVKSRDVSVVPMSDDSTKSAVKNEVLKSTSGAGGVAEKSVSVTPNIHVSKKRPGMFFPAPIQSTSPLTVASPSPAECSMMEPEAGMWKQRDISESMIACVSISCNLADGSDTGSEGSATTPEETLENEAANTSAQVDKLAEDMVNTAIESAKATMISGDANIADDAEASTSSSRSPLKPKNTQTKKSRISLSKYLTNRRKSKTKENSVEDLVDKMREVGIEPLEEPLTPTKTKNRSDSKDCTIL